MFSYNQKKEFIKNIIFVLFILLIAVVSTYYIYHKFQDDRSVDFNSDSLDVTYYEKTGDKISLLKVIPVTDSVGLTSKAYLISIKNNLTEDVRYKVRIVDDIDKVKEDGCEDKIIPKEDIRISIKSDQKEYKIYNLSDLEHGILLSEKIKALDTKNISIRVWVNQDSTLPRGSSMHYHGIMQIIEEDKNIAINR